MEKLGIIEEEFEIAGFWVIHPASYLQDLPSDGALGGCGLSGGGGEGEGTPCWSEGMAAMPPRAQGVAGVICPVSHAAGCHRDTLTPAADGGSQCCCRTRDLQLHVHTVKLVTATALSRHRESQHKLHMNLNDMKS